MSMTHALTLPGSSKSPRLVLAWRIDTDHVLEIETSGRTDDRLIPYRYRLSHKGQTIFDGRDSCSNDDGSPVAETLLRAAGGLLGCLTVRPGDVPDDYFDEYTPEQRAWRDEHSATLSVYADEHRCAYCGDDHNSSTCLTGLVPGQRVGEGGPVRPKVSSGDTMFDGTFGYVRVGELRPWDVLFDPVRQVTGEPGEVHPALVSIRTSVGEQTYGTDALVWTYRPAEPYMDCADCGADAGVACDPVTCCALAALVDAAEAAREEL